jgi:hypothetical protein
VLRAQGFELGGSIDEEINSYWEDEREKIHHSVSARLVASVDDDAEVDVAADARIAAHP